MDLGTLGGSPGAALLCCGQEPHPWAEAEQCCTQAGPLHPFRCPGKSLMRTQQIQPLCKTTSVHPVSWHGQELLHRSRHKLSTLDQGHWTKVTDLVSAACEDSIKTAQSDWLAGHSAPLRWNQDFQLAPRESWKNKLSPLQNCSKTLTDTGKLTQVPQQAPKKLDSKKT